MKSPGKIIHDICRPVLIGVAMFFFTGALSGCKKPEAIDIPMYHVLYVEPGKIVIDGRMDPSEPWALAAPCSDLVVLGENKPARLKTTFRMLWDHAALYLFCEAEDPDIRGTMVGRDKILCREEVMELFLETTGGRSADVFEFEFSPLDQVFDLLNLSSGAHKGELHAWSPADLQWAVKVDGTINNSSDRDQGWTLEARIPFRSFYPGSYIPPRQGDVWGFNFCRIERPAPGVEEDWQVARGPAGFCRPCPMPRLIFEEPERHKIICAEQQNARQAAPALPPGWWSLAPHLDQVKVSANGAGEFHWTEGYTWKTDLKPGLASRYLLKDTKVWKDFPGIKAWPKMLVAARPYDENTPLRLEWQVERCRRLVLWYCISPARQKHLQEGICNGLNLMLNDETGGRQLLKTFIHETEWRRHEIELSPDHKTRLRLIVDADGNSSADRVELRIEGDGVFFSP